MNENLKKEENLKRIESEIFRKIIFNFPFVQLNRHFIIKQKKIIIANFFKMCQY